MTLRPDAQAFDEIKIVTVPRWKDSYMSGSEWRILAEIQFYRKGQLRHSVGCQNIEMAAGICYHALQSAIDNGHAYFASEEDFCDQEGCSEIATVRLRKKHEYCKHGHKTDAGPKDIRQFCQKHATRGDCGLDDADSNYEATQI